MAGISEATRDIGDIAHQYGFLNQQIMENYLLRNVGINTYTSTGTESLKTVQPDKLIKDWQKVEQSTDKKNIYTKLEMPELNKLYTYSIDPEKTLFTAPLCESIFALLVSDQNVATALRGAISSTRSYYFDKGITYDAVRRYKENFDNDLLPIQMILKTTEGSFVKRLQKVIYQKYNYKLPASLLNSIGDLISKNLPPEQSYYIDFVNKFDWNSGDFGDAGSCFWGGMRPGIRNNMAKTNKFFAIRMFKRITGSELKAVTKCGTTLYYKEPDGSVAYKGLGRAWLYKGIYKREVSKILTVSSDIYVLFNAYGPHLDKMSMVTSSVLKLEAKLVKASNNGYTTNTLYLNGGKGILMGEASVVKEIDNFDFTKHDKDLKGVFQNDDY